MPPFNRFFRLVIVAVCGLAALGLGLSGSAQAQSFKSGGDVAVSETVDSTLYASGQTVDISSQVNGDVICAGQNVTISGDVRGDVICAGQNVRITGTVEGDVRLAAQSASLEGTVGGNASFLSQAASISGSGNVAGDVGGFAQTITLNGRVGRDLAVNSSLITLNAPVGRNVNANVARQLTLGSNARVNGAVRYTSQNEVRRQDGAQVGGRVSRSQPQRQTSSLAGPLTAVAIYALLAMLLISMLLVLIMPGVFQRASNQALRAPGRTVLSGLVISLLVPAILLVLAATLIGLPVALIGLLLWILALTLAGPTAAYFIGRLIMRRTGNALVIMLVGSIVLLIAYLIPVLGVLALIGAMWFGLGSLYLSLPSYAFKGYQVRPTNEVLAAKKHKHDD